MMARSHVLIGMAGATLGAAAGVLPLTPAVLVAAVAGSLAPDLDTPYSTAGRLVPFVSAPLYRTVGHRTATHATYGIVVAVLFGAVVDLYVPFAGISFMLGYVLHIAADLLTQEGCAIYFPASRRRVSLWPAVRTGSAWEALTVLPIVAGIATADVLLNPAIAHGGYWAGVLRHALPGH